MVLERKELKDLDLLDRFLFAEAIEDPETMELILEIILGKDIVLKHLPQAEKEQRSFLWSKQVKLDVWAQDTDDVIYDTEVQKRDTKDLPKRSRLYNSMIDSKLLIPGTAGYNGLNDVYIIMITPFDLFGKGRYRYTFRMSCEEVPGLDLRDGVTRIFLNTRGTDAEGESEEIGVRFMNAWEEKLLDKQDGYEEGLEEGLAVGEKRGRIAGRKTGLAEGEKLGESRSRTQIAAKMKSKGMTTEDISEITGLTEDEIAAL